MALFSWRPRRSVPFGTALAAVVLLMSSHLAVAQFTQQGPKLVGTGASGAAEQGFSVALSADGNTAVVGGPLDNSGAGAAWVFTRSGGVWTQQGNKLVGAGASARRPPGLLRRAVCRRQHRHRGRAPGQLRCRGGVGVHPQWRDVDPAGRQAGRHRRKPQTPNRASPSRCRPTATPPSWAGRLTTRQAGAAWVFTRSGGVWTQQGNKLVGTGASGAAAQGASVALSADGNTAIVGGPF